MVERLFENMLIVLKTEGEAQEKAIKEVSHKLQVLEEGLNKFYPDCGQIHAENVGILDCVFLSLFGGLKIHEVLGITVIDPEKTPLVYSWLKALVEIPFVKEALPPQEKLVGLLKFIRGNALKSSAA
ncbi:Glutathione S-transferase, C-terminal-like [Trema orientale]|uniref:Glutathione S-transferase, C-terminal-like n=1 Tax=Trema orientale TaxID=63057 RepID=A0A2P5F773_TREOI|nr:Glutathione S-transferase, C-terminal-like [Trema orientale]